MGVCLQEPGHSIFAKAVSDATSALQTATLTLLGMTDEDLENLAESQDDEELLAADGCLLRA